MKDNYVGMIALRALQMVNEAIEEQRKLKVQLEEILNYLEKEELRKETNK